MSNVTLCQCVYGQILSGHNHLNHVLLYVEIFALHSMSMGDTG